MYLEVAIKDNKGKTLAVVQQSDLDAFPGENGVPGQIPTTATAMGMGINQAAALLEAISAMYARLAVVRTLCAAWRGRVAMLAVLFLGACSPGAAAAPMMVHVRCMGRNETLSFTAGGWYHTGSRTVFVDVNGHKGSDVTIPEGIPCVVFDQPFTGVGSQPGYPNPNPEDL